MSDPSLADDESSEELKELVYLSRITQEERHQLFRADDAFKSFGLRRQWQALIDRLADDRIVRAKRCLEVAEFLASQADSAPLDLQKELLRSAVTKAYYSIHHAIRSITLIENGWEEDGHQESISALGKMLEKEGFRKRSRLDAAIRKELAVARNNRSVTDYSPYDFSRRETKTKDNRVKTQLPASDVAERAARVEWIYITEKDWRKAARHNIDLARKLVDAADEVKRFGKEQAHAIPQS
jgi:uncharacterized protein (UPF0332 family)